MQDHIARARAAVLGDVETQRDQGVGRRPRGHRHPSGARLPCRLGGQRRGIDPDAHLPRAGEPARLHDDPLARPRGRLRDLVRVRAGGGADRRAPSASNSARSQSPAPPSIRAVSSEREPIVISRRATPGPVAGAPWQRAARTPSALRPASSSAADAPAGTASATSAARAVNPAPAPAPAPTRAGRPRNADRMLIDGRMAGKLEQAGPHASRTSGQKPERGSARQRLAPQPRRAVAIQTLDLRSDEPGHVGLHRIADAVLQIGEVAVALREAPEHRGVQAGAVPGMTGSRRSFS